MRMGNALRQPHPVYFFLTSADCSLTLTRMASLRILLALLISLALPVQALAGVMVASACPMTETAVQVDIAAAHDCCPDDDGEGTSCASDLSCHCPAHAAIGTRVFVSSLPRASQAHATTPTQPLSVLPVSLWRPPTLSSLLS